MAIGVLMSGCDGAPATPTSPSVPAAAPTFTVSGTVSEQTSTGIEPVEGIVVEDTNSHRRAVTDRSGSYSLSGLPASATSLSTSKAGYLTTMERVVIDRDTHVNIRVERAGPYTLRGVVSERSDRGTLPVSGVTVVLGEGYPDFIALTNDQGQFAIAGVQMSTWGITAAKDGYETLYTSIQVVGDATVVMTLTRAPR